MTLTAENSRPVPDSAPESVHGLPGRRRLSSYEECELSALIEGGDRDARDRLVEANLGLVVTIARQFCGRGLELDDLTGEGNLGLIRAAKEFQPRFGTRRNRQATSQDIVEFEEEWLIVCPRMERLDARERVILALRYGLEDEFLTFKEIGVRLGITRDWVRKLELHALHKLGDNRSDRAFNWQDGSLSQLRRRGGNAAPAKAKSVKSSPRKGSSGDLTLSRRKPV
jgi:DNA-directed RNA polymerase sigma subunit (sigma70/sigma32)